MFCAHCGAARPDVASFCPICGRPVAAVAHLPSPRLTFSSDVLAAPEVAFFNVGTTKLMVMSISTFNTYIFYWIYKNWVAERDLSRDAIVPWARTLFSAIFIYSLARRIGDRALTLGLRSDLSPGMVTVAFIGLGFCQRLPDPFWMVSFAVAAALIPLQNELARINAERGIPIGSEAKFNGINIAWLVFGALLWLLLIAGLFLPEVD